MHLNPSIVGNEAVADVEWRSRGVCRGECAGESAKPCKRIILHRDGRNEQRLGNIEKSWGVEGREP